MIKLVLADDHLLVRKALRMLLETEGHFTVVGEAADGVEALDVVQKLRPHVLLLDLSIPRIHGLDVVRQITEQTKTKVLVVSMHSSQAYVSEAFDNGATGYVVKDAAPPDLLQAVREVAAGRRYFALAASERDRKFTHQRSKIPTARSDPLTSLTRREKIVLQLAAEGFNNTAIARQLSLSPRTIESHRASLMRKLKFRTQTDIVRFAVRNKVISL